MLDDSIAALREWELHCGPYDRNSCMEDLNAFQEETVSEEPFLLNVAERYFRKYKDINLLLLPILIRRGDLYISKTNTFQIFDLIVNSELFSTTTLTTVHELTFEIYHQFIDEVFFRAFPCLQKLRFHQGCTDETLKIVVRCFPKLTLLDCSKDPDCQITDNGLSLLGQLKGLRHVFFNKFHPRQDLSMPKYTGKGIALLMITLPELVKVTCTDVAMTDALTILELSQSVLSTVTSLDFTGYYLITDILTTSQKTCPNVERLAITLRPEDENLASVQIQNFRKLKELHVNMNASDVKIPNFIWYVCQVIGKQLEVLDFLDVRLIPSQVVSLSKGCPSVKLLTIFVTGESPNYSLEAGTLLFPSLETLEYNGLELQGLHLFMHSRSNLVRLYIIYPPGDNMNVLWILIPGLNFWPNLETLLICVEYNYNRHLMIHMVNVFPSLKRIIIENAEKDFCEIFTSSLGNYVVLESVNGFLRLDGDEHDYLDGRKDYNL